MKIHIGHQYKILHAISHQPQLQHQIPTFILFLLIWAFAPLHVSIEIHDYREESFISLCSIWWELSRIQADLDLPPVFRGEDGRSSTTLYMCVYVSARLCLFPQFITLLQVCSGSKIHLQYKLLIWLLIFDSRLWDRVEASLHFATLFVLNTKRLLLIWKSGDRLFLHTVVFSCSFDIRQKTKYVRKCWQTPFSKVSVWALDRVFSMLDKKFMYWEVH